MKIVEVSRSVGRKVNLGQYEMCDLFCSVKAECDESELEETSKKLLKFCWSETDSEAKKIKEANKGEK